MSFQYQHAERDRIHDWEHLDDAVDKGLAQNAKEATMPFSKLCATLQRESLMYAKKQRRGWISTPYSAIVLPLGKWATESYAGHTQCARERYQVSLATYWVEQLIPAMVASAE